MKRKELLERIHHLEVISLEMQYDIESAVEPADVEHLKEPLDILNKYIAELRSQLKAVTK